jgi:type II secretory pathway predicted ATPase ExeA
MANISKLEVLAEMGFAKNPFQGVNINSSDFARIGRFVTLAVSSRAMVSVVGERGAGKTSAVRAGLRKMKNVIPVHIHANDINKLLVSDIEQALIFDLSSEKPKRGRELRARQLRRILGEASSRNEIALIIEEGHHLHGMTLRSLKRMREMEWMGESELFSVILVCQSNPMNKPGVAEVRLRSDAMYMQGLSLDEIRAFVKRTAGKTFDSESIEAIADLPNSHNYEDLKSILIKLMESALFAGRKKVNISDVNSIFAGGTLEEMRQKAGMSKAELARETGFSQPTVTKILKAENTQNMPSSTKQKADTLRSVIKQHQNNHDQGNEDQQQAVTG